MLNARYSVVSPKEANQYPYPYIYILEDGSFRELDLDEKEYLEELFSPFDGARPYVKNKYSDLTPDKKISGFLRRDRLPSDILEKK